MRFEEDNAPRPDGAPPLESRLAPLTSVFEGRLHPLTLLFASWTAARRLLLPAIPLLLFSREGYLPFFLGLLFFASLAQALVKYFTFRYRIDQGELMISYGVLQRTERNIPLERVQEIRVEQGVLHRLFGVVNAVIETAGGQGPEASLSVLSREEAERLRQAVFARVAAPAVEAAGGPAPAEARHLVRRLGVGELVLAGLTSNHLVTGLVAIGTLWAFIDDLLPDSMYERLAEVIGVAASRMIEQTLWAAVLLAAIVLLGALLLSMVLSVAGSVVLFYGFTLSRRGEDLHRAYGLLTRREGSLPRRRVQVVEIEENMLRRLAGLATLRADTVSGRRQPDEAKNDKGRDVLLPVVWREELGRLLPVIFPGFDLQAAEWHRVSRHAVRRGAIKGGLLLTLLAGVSFYFSPGVFSLWPFLLFPAVYGVSLMRYRNLGYAVAGRYFVTRRGWLGRSTHIVPFDKTQAVEVRQSPFDRRLGLATLVVDTAGQAYTGGGPKIGNLPVDEARRLARFLSREAAHLRFKI